MSDERALALERRFRETGSADDEATWLACRLRAGSVARHRVEVAAHCNHEAALRVLERPPTALPPTVERRLVAAGHEVVRRVSGLEQWAERLSSWGIEATVRGFLSLARHVQPDWERGVGRGDVETTLRAVEDWLLCPCDGHISVAIARRITCNAAGWGHVLPRRAAVVAGLTEALALALAAARAGGQRADYPELLITCAPWATVHRGPDLPQRTPDDVRAAIARELVPWALGTADPVQERVGVRG